MAAGVMRARSPTRWRTVVISVTRFASCAHQTDTPQPCGVHAWARPCTPQWAYLCHPHDHGRHNREPACKPLKGHTSVTRMIMAA